MTHTLDIAAFRAAFPAFANPTTYPDGTITLRWTEAGLYLPTYDSCLFSGDALQLALYQMTAHLLASADLIARGQTNVVVRGSTIDKVTVQLEPPPTRDMWQWWLATTPYGLQLWALMTVRAGTGWYVGGRPERMAFRRVYGGFG